MTESLEIENRACLSRATCGWRKSDLDLQEVWSYWRDVHSPAIARRTGIFVYRQFQWNPVDPAFLGTIAGVSTEAPSDQQLQWTSDIIYDSEASLKRFYSSPDRPEVMSKILGDIDLIVDKSTTYLTLEANMSTLVDTTATPTPQGAPTKAHYGLFFRAGDRGPDLFRRTVVDLARHWAALPGILRVRYNLFEVPDMEADRQAGYPVKTHPLELQYQALVEIVTESATVGEHLFANSAHLTSVAEVHAYPAAAVYSFVWAGNPTVVGLRGYPAYRAIESLGAEHALDGGLLAWMYGPAAEPVAATEERGVFQ